MCSDKHAWLVIPDDLAAFLGDIAAAAAYLPFRRIMVKTRCR
jgi:hypothetical protein